MNRESGSVFKHPQVKHHIDQVREIAEYLWAKGWIERNGGNLSINLSGLVDCRDDVVANKITVDLPQEGAGMVLLVTCSGARLRELTMYLEKNMMVIRIDDDARGYAVLHGGSENSPATSELASHILLHARQQTEGDPAKRCLLHCHPPCLLAASYHPDFTSGKKSLNNVLWSMLPEVRLFVPNGLAVVPYALAGSIELARNSCRYVTDYDALLWEKHGMLAMGANMVEAFDCLDVLEKGARILLSCLSAGYFPQGLTDVEMDALARAYLSD